MTRNFYDSNYRVPHKILLQVYVDYLPGDILVYTDRDGWNNIFVKDEFYGRTKSETGAAREARKLYNLMVTDFYELKSPEAKAEQEGREASLKGTYNGLLVSLEEARAKVNRYEEKLADLKHNNPFIKFDDEDRKEN